ncbi:MAG: hypothetical protein IT462_01895 [Planctomycetes bacterium]|nr:hypothetical protein [Planctomycetota bacterium]
MPRLLPRIFLLAAVLFLGCSTPVVADKASFKSAEKDFKAAQTAADEKKMVAAIDAIGAADCKEALEFLLDTLEKDQKDAKAGKGLPGDVHDHVVSAITALAKDEESVERIGKAAVKLDSDKMPILALDQFDFFKPLAAMTRSAAATKHLTAALTDKKNPYVKVAALEAIRQAKNPTYLDTVLGILAEDNKEWMTKWKIVPLNVFCCIEDLVTPGSDQAIRVVETLCTQWETWTSKIKDFQLDDRLKYFSRRMLNRLTGEVADLSFVIFWKWWVQQKKAPAAAAQPKKPDDRSTDFRSTPAFGAEPVGKKWVFVIDVSDSMKLDLKITLEDIEKRKPEKSSPITPGKGEKEGEKPEEKEEPAKNPLAKLDWKNINFKIDLAKAELARAIKELPEGYQFAIVTYSTSINLITGNGWVKSDQTNRDTWERKARELQLEALTNIHGGLMKGLRVCDKGSEAAEPAVDPDCIQSGADTIIFLTDGWGSWSDDSKVQNVQDKRNPNNPGVKVGDGTHIYGEDIWPDIARHNLFRKVVINTVGIGNHDKECLRKLAEKSGGTYVDWGFPES